MPLHRAVSTPRVGPRSRHQERRLSPPSPPKRGAGASLAHIDQLTLPLWFPPRRPLKCPAADSRDTGLSNTSTTSVLRGGVFGTLFGRTHGKTRLIKEATCHSLPAPAPECWFVEPTEVQRPDAKERPAGRGFRGRGRFQSQRRVLRRGAARGGGPCQCGDTVMCFVWECGLIR